MFQTKFIVGSFMLSFTDVWCDPMHLLVLFELQTVEVSTFHVGSLKR